MNARIWWILIGLGALIAGWRLFRYLRDSQRGFWSSLWAALNEAWGWLPGSDAIKEIEEDKARRTAFLKRRRERSRGNLTDDF